MATHSFVPARPALAPPLCMAISVEDFEAWLLAADAGDVLVYARGPVLDQRRDVVVLARGYVAEGEVRTHQRKVAGGFEYFAVRRNPELDVRRARRGSTSQPAPAREPEPETPLGRMLAILRRCARLRVPARTNAELAREMGLKDAEAARYLFNQLVEGSLITVQNMGTRERRIVTIVATGQETARGRL